jgi:2-polyprenyl-3-methyl-5-hydroxy-6-metoxy-1,4-benzoquinol methylase
MCDFFFPDMSARSDEKELMDRPDIDLRRLLTTVKRFKHFNMLFSASRKLILEHFFFFMELNPGRKYTLLDIGSGGCDIPVWIVRHARRRGIDISVTALDNDSRILPVAKEAIRRYPEIDIVTESALNMESLGDYDFMFSNHFLHHLSWNEIESVMNQILAHTRIAFVMNDLLRSRWAYAGFTFVAGIVAGKSLAFYDGRLSIRRGFKVNELSGFMRERFPGSQFVVGTANPARIYLSGKGSDADASL